MRKLQLLVAILALSRTSLPADFAPALQWVKTIDGSGDNTVTAAAADASGNLYIVGTTSSIDFPATAAAQRNAGGTPLVRINTATGVADKLYPPGLSAAGSIAADPRNPQTLYASAKNKVFRSGDAGSTWSLLSLVAPSVAVRFVAIDPSDSNILYAATDIQGVLKSTDSGLTWNAINTGIAPFPNGAISATRVWVDPKSSQVLFAATNDGLMRSANAGAAWTVVVSSPFFNEALVFDPFLAGTLFLGGASGIVKSTDDGQTFLPLSGLPDQDRANALVADPFRAGVLYAGSFSGGMFQSIDSGVTWNRKVTGQFAILAADPNNPVFYADTSTYGMLKTTDGFSTTSPIGPPVSSLRQILVAGPNVFEMALPSNDVFAAKLDANGNIVYATYFGGSAYDAASAMALGPDGSLYVTGTTTSVDFPTTAGAYAKAMPGIPGSPSSFVFKLNPDGSLGWSTYFADSRSTVDAIAVDSAGNPYVGGASGGNLPTTPGAYQTQFQQTSTCPGFIGGCLPGPTSAFVAKFNAQGAGLIYSTFVPSDSHKNTVTVAQALVVDSAGNAWFGGRGNVVVVNGSGSALLASTAQTGIIIAALALDSSSNLYATGAASPDYANTTTPAFIFPATAGAFQPAPQPAVPVLPGQMTPGGFSDAFVIKWDSSLSRILAATLLGGELADYGESIAIDPAGNVIVSGETDSRAFPTHAPFQISFSSRAGFVAGLDPSLSHLLFSTYLGDGRPFDARATALDGHGNILLAGSTLSAGSLFIGSEPGQSYNIGSLVVANKIALPTASTVRLDSVVHFASRMAQPIAPGEPIMAIGAGFGADAQFLIDGVALAGVTANATTLVAVMPDSGKTSGAYLIQVSTGGTLSNPVYVPAAPASPGIYSVDGSGYGQGYILNSDGTLNSPTNPAPAGSAITIFAAGVGPFTLDNGYAVTALPPSVFIDGFYANGIAAVSKPVDRLPGTVYQIGVYVPNPATFADRNPNLLNFKFPPQVGVKLIIGAVGPFNPDSSAMISQGGIVLNVK